MAGVGIVNVDASQAGQAVRDVFGGVGQLIKDIRTAITGKEPLDQTKQLELLSKLQEMEMAIQNATISVALAEAKSEDRWTSRSRPMFLYVIYVFILAAFPMGILGVFRPDAAKMITEGVNAWLTAIPNDMWYLFGAGYLGYGAFRSWDKRTLKGAGK